MTHRDTLLTLAARVEAAQGAQGADRELPPLHCNHCGVKLPASCPADEGYGCPSWEQFKEDEADAAALRALAEETPDAE